MKVLLSIFFGACVGTGIGYLLCIVFDFILNLIDNYRNK